MEHLAPLLEPVELPRYARLETPNKTVEFIYFMETGITSMVSVTDPATEVEIGLIGNEGMTGIAVILGNHRSPYASYIQVEATAQRIEADALREIMDNSPGAQKVFLRFAHSFLIQTTQTAVTNVRATIEERLARWLLMAHDRLEGDKIHLTHEFLSVMMGARRPGVTEAVQSLSRKGLILGARGSIEIIDRAALEKRAGRYYGIPEKEYARLLR